MEKSIPFKRLASNKISTSLNRDNISAKKYHYYESNGNINNNLGSRLATKRTQNNHSPR
jgi:hypothetical protein